MFVECLMYLDKSNIEKNLPGANYVYQQTQNLDFDKLYKTSKFSIIKLDLNCRNLCYLPYKLTDLNTIVITERERERGEPKLMSTWNHGKFRTKAWNNVVIW